jgi:hypothetical protein
MKRLRLFILKISLTKEEIRFIDSALYTAEQTYKNNYNNIKSASYQSPILQINIPKLVRIREMFDGLL